MDSTFDETAEGPQKLDHYVISKEIVRIMKMRYDISSGFANEYYETVQDYFHEQNITPTVKEGLGWIAPDEP